MVANLDIQREVVEFKGLQEDGAQSPPLSDHHLPVVLGSCRHPVLVFRLREDILDVDEGIPTLGQVDLRELLKEITYTTRYNN